MTGPLVYVMGPSGAGKDSVLGRARAMLSIDLPVVFAHRYITRPVDAGGENHVALSHAEFALRRAHGLFAFHWQAHGNDYGIGLEDRGEIAPGHRADLVRVRQFEEAPMVRAVWCAGERVV